MTLALLCAPCAPAVDARIHAPDFWFNLGVLLLPVALLVAVALLLYRCGGGGR
ncbi:hypothetical protein [Ideonella sp. BN130291]|uniref:hypothetical protein n=1 Tax=Ideonella sp. BN130291 TaxID=3112940 RepID=UPI002E270CEC|nr:hypothetical protein [Ideonella sp. BN130291]